MAPWLPWLVAILSLVNAALAQANVSRRERAHQREREALTNQIMHLAGRTWQPPPGLNNGPEETIEPLPQYDFSAPIMVEEDDS